jgi:hypothetical protein
VTALTFSTVGLTWLGTSAPLTATAAPPGYTLTVASNVSSLQAIVALSDPLGHAVLVANGTRTELLSGAASSPLPLPLGVSLWTLSTPVGAQQALTLRIVRLPPRDVAGESFAFRTVGPGSLRALQMRRAQPSAPT